MLCFCVVSLGDNVKRVNQLKFAAGFDSLKKVLYCKLLKMKFRGL